jgi:hypothetical protein
MIACFSTIAYLMAAAFGAFAISVASIAIADEARGASIAAEVPPPDCGGSARSASEGRAITPHERCEFVPAGAVAGGGLPPPAPLPLPHATGDWPALGAR